MTRPLNRRSTPKLKEAREIGWSIWDPLYLVEYRPHCDDEYDDYILTSLGMFHCGHTIEDVSNYLYWIEQIYMNRREKASMERCQRFAEALNQFRQ